MEPLETRDLAKHYGDLVAVDGVDLQAREGQIVGLLGPNGAGKTTTIQMLTGLVRPTRGSAHVLGHEVAKQPVEARESLGYLPEEVGVYDAMTGRQFLRYTGRFFEFSPSEITRRVESLLSAVGLARAGNRRAKNYSKGMKQRLGLAAALFQDPDVLVLDEPLTGLDPEGVMKMRQAIRRLGEDKTLLLSSHTLHAVEDLCDRVVVIDDGQVLADAPIDDVLRDDPVQVQVVFEEPVDAEGLADRPGIAAVDADGETVTLTLTDDRSPGEVLRSLIGDDLPVASFTPQTESLEDAFARLTGVVRR